MERKMALLEQAHGMLCNAQCPESVTEDEWRTMLHEWIERWCHIVKDQEQKKRNKFVSIGNDAIMEYENKRNVYLYDAGEWIVSDQ